jgi:hypothetical protein
MDRKFSKDQEIQRLIQLSASARSCLGNEAILLKKRMDVPARIRGSLRRNPTGWLLGSLGSGIIASLIFRRKAPSVEKKKRGLSRTIMGLTLTAVRPLAKVWITDQVKGFLARQGMNR